MSSSWMGTQAFMIFFGTFASRNLRFDLDVRCPPISNSQKSLPLFSRTWRSPGFQVHHWLWWKGCFFSRNSVFFHPRDHVARIRRWDGRWFGGKGPSKPQVGRPGPLSTPPWPLPPPPPPGEGSSTPQNQFAVSSCFFSLCGRRGAQAARRSGPSPWATARKAARALQHLFITVDRLLFLEAALYGC